jgi:hypothetical protein
MQQITTRLGTLPINITFLENGMIALSPQGNFGTLVDGIAMYDDKGFSVGVKQYFYGVMIDYKREPDLLTYLKSLDLDTNVIHNQFAAEKQMREKMKGFHFNF